MDLIGSKSEGWHALMPALEIGSGLNDVGPVFDVGPGPNVLDLGSLGKCVTNTGAALVSSFIGVEGQEDLRRAWQRSEAIDRPWMLQPSQRDRGGAAEVGKGDRVQRSLGDCQALGRESGFIEEAQGPTALTFRVQVAAMRRSVGVHRTAAKGTCTALPGEWHDDSPSHHISTRPGAVGMNQTSISELRQGDFLASKSDSPQQKAASGGPATTRLG